MKTNNQEKQEAATAMIVLESLKKEAAPLMKKLERIDLITSKEHYANAMAQMKLLKDLGKAAKEKEKSLTDPLKQVVGDIQQLFKPFLTRVSEIESSLKQQMVEYLNEQEAKEKKLVEDFQNGKIKKVQTFADKSAELSMQRSGARKLFRANCVDVSKTPKKFLVPDVSAITAALKAGEKVAGWELIEEKSIAI